MGERTSTYRHGLLLMLVALFASTSIAYAQNAEKGQNVSYVKHIDDNGNQVMYEVINQPAEVAKTRSAVQAQENDELQKLIDRLADAQATRAASTVTDIDLSAYSEPRTNTLYIRNGVNVRFINGTLTRATSLTDAPLVQIIDDSELHLAETAAISGNNFLTSKCSLVEVHDGRLDVEGGKITGNRENNRGGISVWLRNTDAVVWMSDGEVDNMASGSGKVSATGGTIGFLSISNYVNLWGTVKAYCYFSSKETYIDCSDELRSAASITLSYYYPDQTVVKNVSQAVVNCFKLGYSENISGSTSDYWLSLENGSLIVRSKVSTDPNLIYNEDQLRTRLKEIADNKESSASNPVKLTVAPEGFSISSSVLVSSCYVEISGGRITVAKNTSHSPFMVFDGSGLTLNNIEIDFNNFDSYYRGFDNNGGYLTIGSGAVFLNAVSSNWYKIPFYYLYGGTTTISPTNCNIENEVFSIYFSRFQNNVVLFTASVDYAIIQGKWDEYNSEEPYTLIKGSNYTLKESDFKGMKFDNLPDNLEVYYDSSDHSVKLRKKTDPNYITDEDWLQKRIDEIAASNEKKAELTIAENGITLTKGVYVRAETNITITGGTISLADSFNDNAAFYLEKSSYLTYNNIVFDLRNVYLPTSFVQSLAFSVLQIWDNVEFLNIYNGPQGMAKGFFNCYINISPKSNIFSLEVNRGSVIYGLGPEINLSNCSLRSNGGYPTIAGEGAIYMYNNSQIFGDGKAPAVIHLPQGGLNMSYGQNTLVHADNNGSVVNTNYGILRGSGKFEGRDASFNRIEADDDFVFAINQLTITGDGHFSGNVKLPRLYITNGARIELTSNMTSTWIIDGDWSSFNVETPYTLISGYNYTITEEDYSRMQFANMPDNVEAVYDTETKVVWLQKKEKECDLQDLIDGLCTPVPGGETKIPKEGGDIGCDDPLQCAVDATLDGSVENDEPEIVRPRLAFPKCNCDVFINVHYGSSLTIRHYDITSNKEANQYFIVSGTLIIDVNVYIYHFIRFIHILPGGRVIWRGGHTEDVDEIVYNQGGILEIEGDFDNGGKTYVNPEGGTLIIRDGIFNGNIENHGTLIIEGGTICGGVVNYGTFTFSGGIINGGSSSGLVNYSSGIVTIFGGTIKCDGGTIYDVVNYSGGQITIYNGTYIGEGGGGCIWSETDIWIEGGVYVTNIHIKRGACIRVIGRMTVVWRIHFFVFDEFDIFVPIVKGANGYLLTEEDYTYILIDLPIGYEWRYNHWEYTIFIWSKGDANGDYHLNAADIVEIVNYIMGRPSDTFNISDADVNNDGVVNAADIVAIVNIIMKL